MNTQFDLVVFGAGSAGIAAAVTAGKAGLKVALIERATVIGGVISATQGMMLGGGYPCGKTMGGFFEDFVQRMYNQKPPRAVRKTCLLHNFGDEVIYDYDYALETLYDMLSEAGVKLVMSATATKINTENDTVTSVDICHADGNIVNYTAKMFVDCTGNGDIAYRAGVPCEKGGEGGAMMGGGLTFYMDNVDIDKVFVGGDPYFSEYTSKGIAEGKLDKTLQQMYMLPAFRERSVYFNAVIVTGLDGTDPDNVEKCSRLGRKRAFELAEFCIDSMPGFENAYLSRMGEVAAVRDTLRLEGLHQLTYDEIENGTRFEDGIVACDNPCDIIFSDDDNPMYKHDRSVVSEGNYYTIPARCLVPKKVKNLMFAGRHISADWLAFSSLRGMCHCMLMGQATAVMAEMAIKNGKTVQETDFLAVVKEMQKQGVKGIGGEAL